MAKKRQFAIENTLELVAGRSGRGLSHLCMRVKLNHLTIEEIEVENVSFRADDVTKYAHFINEGFVYFLRPLDLRVGGGAEGTGKSCDVSFHIL